MEWHDETGSQMDLANYRLEQAQTDICSAKILSDVNDYRGANNRAYYAIFHSISALYALEGKAYKRHKDALANFNKEYVKTEIFSKELGRKIARAEEIRHASDYDDFYIARKEDALAQIETAEMLITQVKKYIYRI